MADQLTPELKAAVTKSWEPVAANQKHFGVLLFIKYFEDCPGTQDLFKHFKGLSVEELHKSVRLRAHGTTVMHAVTAIVAELDDLETLVLLLDNQVERHVSRGVTYKNYEELFGVLAAFLKIHLGDTFSGDVAKGWGIVVGVMLSVMKKSCETYGCM